MDKMLYGRKLLKDLRKIAMKQRRIEDKKGWVYGITDRRLMRKVLEIYHNFWRLLGSDVVDNGQGTKGLFVFVPYEVVNGRYFSGVGVNITYNLEEGVMRITFEDKDKVGGRKLKEMYGFKYKEFERNG